MKICSCNVGGAKEEEGRRGIQEEGWTCPKDGGVWEVEDSPKGQLRDFQEASISRGWGMKASSTTTDTKLN